MDVVTNATVLMMLPSANLNDLSQAFIHDPPAPNVPVFVFEARRNGDNITGHGVLTPGILRHIAEGHYRFMTSSMVWDALRKTGHLPKLN